MWLTDFDVPSCSTICLDKPMRNYTFMQTIARANRVFKDKTNSLIVDYVGIFWNLERAPAMYGAPTDDRTDFPIKDKKELKTHLKMAIYETETFLKKYDVDLGDIIETEDVFQRTKKKDDTIECILITEDSKKEYLNLADKVQKISKGHLPDSIEEKYRLKVYMINRALNLKKEENELNREEKRHIREELDEEELAVFDILTRPELKLTKKDEKQVKGITRQLLTTLKEEKLVLD